MGGARAKKLWFSLSCTQPDISYYVPTVPTEIVHSKLRCTFWGSRATRYQEAQIGKPQIHEELWFQKLISSIPLNVEKFTNFNGTMFFISEQNGTLVARKLADEPPSRIDAYWAFTRSDPSYVRLSVRPVGQTGWTDCSRTAHMMSIKSMWPVSWL